MGSLGVNPFLVNGFRSRGLLFSGVLSLLSACQGTGSDVKVVGGEVEDGHPEVLRVLTDSESLRVCTGVVISQDVLLIAGHCLNEKSLTEGVTVETTGTSGQKVSSKIIVGYNALRGASRLSVDSARHDLAAVVYPKGTFRPPFAKLATTPAKKGEVVKIVGYGASSFEDAAANLPLDGRKRSGNNTLIYSANGLLFLEANIKAKNLTNNAIAAFGDSGGPVYRNGEFVGILAGLYFSNPQGPIKVADDAAGNPVLPLAQAEVAGNLIVDLQSAESKAVIDAAVKGSPEALDQSKISTSLKGDDYLAVCGGGKGSNLFGGGRNNSDPSNPLSGGRNSSESSVLAEGGPNSSSGISGLSPDLIKALLSIFGGGSNGTRTKTN